jgi:hypothetical protein
LTIPKADTIKRHVVDMGKDVETQLKELILVCFQNSLSLLSDLMSGW